MEKSVSALQDTGWLTPEGLTEREEANWLQNSNVKRNHKARIERFWRVQRNDARRRQSCQYDITNIFARRLARIADQLSLQDLVCNPNNCQLQKAPSVQFRANRPADQGRVYTGAAAAFCSA